LKKKAPYADLSDLNQVKDLALADSDSSDKSLDLPEQVSKPVNPFKMVLAAEQEQVRIYPPFAEVDILVRGRAYTHCYDDLGPSNINVKLSPDRT
jgi:hypothetical protein